MNDSRLRIDKYWHIVEASLRQFFNKSPSEAYGLTTAYRLKIEKRFSPEELGVVYNREEYDIACQLADSNDEAWESDREQYFKLKFSYEAALESALSESA